MCKAIKSRHGFTAITFGAIFCYNQWYPQEDACAFTDSDLLPNVLQVLYHLIIHVIIKPDEKYNDSYRYLCTKFGPAKKARQHLPEKWVCLLFGNA